MTILAATGGKSVAAVEGLRTFFLNEFLKQGYARHQETKLRKRIQGINEPGAEYCYEIINFGRLMDRPVGRSDDRSEGVGASVLWVEIHLEREKPGNATEDVRGVLNRNNNTLGGSGGSGQKKLGGEHAGRRKGKTITGASSRNREG